MPKSLIQEAARRGKAEAECRDLQYKINDAFNADVDKVEQKRRRKLEQKEEKRRKGLRAATASRNLYFTLVQAGWFVLCCALAYNKVWEAVPDIRRFLYGKEILAYIAMLFIFSYGRKYIRELLGVGEQRW